MFGYIKGEVTEIYLDYAIIETGGLGFKLITSQFTNERLEVGKQAKLFTKMNVREDDISLFGFWDKNEMRMFELLTSVSKVGPKVGFGVLSTYNTENLQLLISRGDVAMLSKAPGVGKKTAERIIVELKDKVGKVDAAELTLDKIINTDFEESLQVLMSLGFSKVEASEAIEKAVAKHKPKNTNDMVKYALGNLSRL